LLHRSKDRLSGREGRDVCQVAIFGGIRESRYAKGNLHNARSGPPVGVRRGRGWCRRVSYIVVRGVRLWSTCSYRVGLCLNNWPPGRPKTGHLADASTLGAPYSSARGRGQIPFPIGFTPGLPHYWPRCFPHRIWRGHYSVGRSYSAGTRQAFAVG
jgi:hypothetical protein